MSSPSPSFGINPGFTEENLKLFEDMRKGLYEDGEWQFAFKLPMLQWLLKKLS